MGEATVEERRARYQRVLGAVCQMEVFTVRDVQQCAVIAQQIRYLCTKSLLRNYLTGLICSETENRDVEH